jgi:hypothetical protein
MGVGSWPRTAYRLPQLGRRAILDEDDAILALITESFKGSPFEDVRLEFGRAVSSKWSMSILLDRKDTMVTIELKGTKGNPKASFDVSDPG